MAHFKGAHCGNEVVGSSHVTDKKERTFLHEEFFHVCALNISLIMQIIFFLFVSHTDWKEKKERKGVYLNIDRHAVLS